MPTTGAIEIETKSNFTRKITTLKRNNQNTPIIIIINKYI